MVFSPKSLFINISLCFHIVIILNAAQYPTKLMYLSDIGHKDYFQFYTFWRMLQMSALNSPSSLPPSLVLD